MLMPLAEHVKAGMLVPRVRNPIELPHVVDDLSGHVFVDGRGGLGDQGGCCLGSWFVASK